MSTYQYCSKEECNERQELGQVSELEATIETCRLPQSKRILDPRIAISKYRRSAAGGNDGRMIRDGATLKRALSHLIQICATLRSTPGHPPATKMGVVVSFVVDRLRACQSDATRLMSDRETCLPSSWHACVIRILIWLRYACCDAADNDRATADANARMIDHMRSTAYDAYWGTADQRPSLAEIDDEMMCYDAISRICAISKHSTMSYAKSLETSWNGILLEFSKRRRPGTRYPLWNLALEIASHAQREEYYILWKTTHSWTNKLPILAKTILSGETLLFWRYRTVQHFNKSFGKSEPVVDMNRLLGIAESDIIGEGWSIEYANIFGIPVEEANNNENDSVARNRPTITMKLKQVAMPEWNQGKADEKTALRIRNSDRRWIYGDSFIDSSGPSPLGMNPEAISRLLEFGCFSSTGVHFTSLESQSTNENKVKGQPLQTSTSLSRALASSVKTDTQPKSRGSSLQSTIRKEKINKKNSRRFRHNNRGGRNRDQRRFEHSA